MTLWDSLPDSAKNGGALSALEDALSQAADSGPTDGGDGWKVWTKSFKADKLLKLDSFGGIPGGGTPIEFRDPNVTIEIGLHQTGDVDDGGWRVVLTSPVVAVHLPFLNPAKYDAPNARLVPDPTVDKVVMVVGGLKLRLMQLKGESVRFDFLSASTTGNPADRIYDLVRMEPPYATVGPQATVGIGFRAAVLDLSSVAGPSGLPAGARAMPDAWQGFYLPEVRVFVQPPGLEDLYITAAARDLYIGVGASAGLTAIFEAEVVNAAELTVSAHVLTKTGKYIPVVIADPTAEPAHGTAAVPAQSTLFIDTHGGSGSNTVTIAPGNASTVHGTRAGITTDAGGTVIQVTVVDAAAGLTKHLTVTTTLDAPAAGGGGGGGVTSLSVAPTSPITQYRIVVDSLDPAVVRLDPAPPAAATIAWSSTPPILTGGTDKSSVTVDLSALTATNPITSALSVTVTGQTEVVSDCHFLFDHPSRDELANPKWALTPENTRDRSASHEGHAPGARSYKDAAKALAAQVGTATPLQIDGYASYEKGNAKHNLDLSERRRQAAIAILTDAGFSRFDETPHKGEAFGEATAHARTPAAPDIPTPENPLPGESDGFWWLARVRAFVSQPLTVTADLKATREDWDAGDDTQKDVTPAKQPQPTCFRRIGARVEILRDTFIRAEIWAEFDFSSAAEQAKPGLGLTGQEEDNPGDGIVDFLLRLRISEDRASWQAEAEIKAHGTDKDGLYRRKRGDGIPDLVIDSVGALAVLAPLTAAASSLSPAGGAVAMLGAIGVGALGVMKTQELTLYGGQLVISDGAVSADGSTGDDTVGYKVSVFFDVETKFTFDLLIIRTLPDKPMSARYKAIGVAAQWGGATDPGFRPLAVFDPSKGYTIDAPEGSLVAISPLDEVLRIFGFKVSRDNPMFVEVEFGIGLEIGILTIETATVRAAFDGGAPDISISRLSATLDVPGVLHGTGVVAISETQISGGFDATVASVGIRVGATLTIHKGDDGNVGVLFGGAVEFPAPILLGSSGLGIYGFLGGMGINFARIYKPTSELPALDWAVDHMKDSGIELFSDKAWEYSRGDYSFGAGLVMGTVDGGFTLNLKGVLLISVPGPQITLMALANVLSPELPGLIGEPSATILAVIDLDFGRGTVLVALRVHYKVGGLLEIDVPVTAFFDTDHASKWYVELGSHTHPATVTVFNSIKGSGYLEVHGDGLSLPTQPPLSSKGLSFGAGFHIDAVLMGKEEFGLYFRVAAGFDALFSPSPLYIGGIFEVSGELRLWIISISASAKLDIIYRGESDEFWVHGEVHGKVDFFFFSIEGSIELTIGTKPAPAPPAVQPLVTGVGLVGRTIHVLLEGSSAGEPVDAVIAKALEGAGDAPDDIPIDAIPVLSFRTLAKTDQADVLGGTAPMYGGAPFSPWTQLGDLWWRYEVTAVRLTGGDLIPPTAAGHVPPSVWWVEKNEEGALSLQLALLNWTPDPHPAAVPYGEALTSTVTRRWGTVCAAPSDPAAILWTFDGQPFGPSTTGWRLTGIPWPDAPGTVRTAQPVTGLAVTEPWRIAPPVDVLQGTEPAVVVGDAVPCFDGARHDGVTVLSEWAKGQPAGFSSHGRAAGSAALAALDGHIASGGSLYDFPAARQATAWDPAAVTALARGAAPTRRRGGKDAGCVGEILRSPVRDVRDPAPNADEATRKFVEEAWGASGFRPDPLRDAVSFDAGGPLGRDGFDDVAVLLLLPRIGFEYGLVVSARTADGDEIEEHRVSPADIATASGLPERWLEPQGPWADPISRAGHLAARIASSEALIFAYVRIGGYGGKAARIVTGWRNDDISPLPPYYVIAVEGLLGSERRRFEWDLSTLNADQQALSQALTQPPGTEPLLTPDTPYTVEVDWTATWLPVSGDQHSPQPGARPDDALLPSDLPPERTSPGHQQFRFRTKKKAVVPADVVTDLSPWVLGTVPAQNETGVFTHAGVTLTLSSQRVAALFDAYDLELHAVVHAASGIHPRLGDAPAPAVPVTPESDHASTADPYGVVSPWREAAEEVVTSLGCLDSLHFDRSTFTLTIPYVFEPLTEYLLDVHARRKGTAGPGDIVYRVPFRTGRFADEAEFAGFVGAARAQGRGLLAPGELAPLTGAVAGAALDDAFQRAGLGAPEVPLFPAVNVLWSTDDEPQPVAVVVESSEEIARWRPTPQKVVATTADPDPTQHYWASVPWPWLTVAAATSPPDPDLPDAAVDRVVTGPGGTRAIVFLAAGARGRRLRLELVHDLDGPAGSGEARTPLLSVDLLAAPWEDED